MLYPVEQEQGADAQEGCAVPVRAPHELEIFHANRRARAAPMHALKWLLAGRNYLALSILSPVSTFRSR